jgi:hypothetical protein
MKSNKKTFLVFNATDGFYAHPDRMTKEEAETFIKEFPERYRNQGYYRTSQWLKIRPEDVVLKIVPIMEAPNICNHVRKKKPNKGQSLER